MSEWKEVYLNDVYEISSGLSKPAEDFGTGFPFLTFKEVFNNFFIPDKLSELVESNEKERFTCSIKRGDVFLTRTSETVKELGMSCVALKDYENATFNGFTKRLRPKKNIEIVPEYVGYYFRNSKFRKEITSMSSASTRASLNIEMIGRLKILLPSKEEQFSIGHILKTLDDKIENLRLQNETLEAIAQTLFKHWFIDFEFPDADGKPYKSSGGGMWRSAIGDIPEGWHVGKLGQYLNIKHGYAFKGEYITTEETDKILLTPVNFKIGGGFNDSKYKYYSDEYYLDEYVLKKRDLTVTMTDLSKEGDTLGYPAFIPEAKGKVFLHNQRIGKVETDKIDKTFLYFLLCRREYRSHILGTASGSTVRHTSPSRICEYSFAIPDFQLINKFSDVATVIIDKILINFEQIQTLTKTRDALLPKLMSGQLRIEE